MSALSARVAVVSGRNAIGIELPNPTREKVYLRELLATSEYNESSAKLPLCLGKTIGGEPVIVDLARMPHLLIAGTTGSGKSVAINTMILSLLYRLTPDQCRLIMVDPKMLELSVYDAHPASAHAGRHRPEEGGGRAQVGGARDGGALQENVEARRAQHRRLQRARRRGQGQGREALPHRSHRLRQGERRGDLRGRGARSRAVALHRHHRRRDGRPDDGGRQGHRRRGAAAGADGARRRPARDPRHAAAVGRRHHRHHQGEFPDPHLVPGHVQDRQPHHPGRAGRRTAARPGRHALHGRRRTHQPRARPVRAPTRRSRRSCGT